MELNFGPVLESWRFLAGGLYITILLSLSVAACSMVFGTLVALGRRYGPNWLRVILVFYIDFRCAPFRCWSCWCGSISPSRSPPASTCRPSSPRSSRSRSISPPMWPEIVRAGIESVRPGQVRAGLALGMSGVQIVRKIVLPQALVRMLPALGNVLTLTVKDTAIATVIAVPELMRRADAVAGQSYTPVEVFTTAMFLYFLILFPITRGVDLLYRRIGFLGRS